MENPAPAQVQTQAAPNTSTAVSDKDFVPTILLCFFLGTFGVHRFYVGKIGTGILMIVTLGGLGFWTMIDFIMIVVGAFKDKKGLPVKPQ